MRKRHPSPQVIRVVYNHDRFYRLIDEIAGMITAGQTVDLGARCVIALALWNGKERVVQQHAKRSTSGAAVEALLSAGAEGRSITKLRKLLSRMLKAIEAELG